MTFRPAIFDSDVLSFDIAKLTQSLAECVDSGRRFTWRSAAQEPDHRYRRLLGACCKRPRRRAAEQRDEIAPPDHSITSSARTSMVGGTLRPIALAVLRLNVSMYLVGCCTGRSLGASPRRMRLTYSAVFRKLSSKSLP